jgi:2-dehydropantoate 2-reductase
MKIAIIGAGAMGSIYASFLAQNNNEVLAIDLWEEHLEAIRKDGLRVSGFSGDNVVKNINVSNNIEDAKGYELFIIATKASGVGSAASNLSKIISKNSLILTIQNGLGAGERIATFMPTDNILLGVAQGFGAAMVGPGHAHHNNMSMIRIGEMNGGMTSRLETLVKTWCDAGFNAKAFDDIEQLIWEKFVCNVAWSGSCSIFRKTIGQVMESEEMFNIAKGCAIEAKKWVILKKLTLRLKKLLVI